MPTTDDPDTFRKRWNSHIDELESLKLSLPPDRFEDVDVVIEEAKELVDAGATNMTE